MFRTICVPVDNSEHSNSAIDLALSLAKAAGGEIVGSHVYAGRLHDVRFRQMEFTLPAKYQSDEELERQRTVHDSLIAKGLRLISDSYLDVLERQCAEAGVPFTRKTFDGRNYQVLARDIAENRYDLVVMGAQGMGATRESHLGSVAERVLRRVSSSDLIIVRGARNSPDAPILTAIDGSPQSFAGLRTALDLAKAFNRPVKAVAVYDPYLHYHVFNGIVGVLSEQAAKVFKFKEQEELHEQIIDTGLAKIYQSHLDVAKRLAAEEGVPIEVHLLAGKAFEKILQFARREAPWLLVAGRIGIHGDADMEIGSNVENLVRLAPCSVYLASRTYVPPMDVRAEAALTWSGEAVKRMSRVPEFVRGIARSAIQRWALELGHSVVTSAIIDQAIGDLLPESALRAMGMAAQAADRKSGSAAAICGVCGYTARAEAPAGCSVCGAGPDRFRALEGGGGRRQSADEGGLVEERTFDGVSLEWTEDALATIASVGPGPVSRRVRSRIEKTARVLGVATITRAFVEQGISEETGEVPISAEKSDPAVDAGPDSGFEWEPDAEARLSRAPAGFMQEMIRKKIERIAAERGLRRITLDLAEEAIAHGRKVMAETMAAAGEDGESVNRKRQAVGDQRSAISRNRNPLADS